MDLPTHLQALADAGDELAARHLAGVARLKAGQPDPVEVVTVRRRHPALGVIDRLKTCPHLVPPACGCAWGTCLQGRGSTRGEVGYHDCLACPDRPA